MRAALGVRGCGGVVLLPWALPGPGGQATLGLG